MSKDLNLCQFIGRLGQDPEIRYSNDGKAIANLSLACSDDYKDVEQTNWIRVVAFGRLAEIIGEYVNKGSQLYISGKQVTRKWQDQSGQDRYTTEIVADQMQMLGGGSNDRQMGNQASERPKQPSSNEPNPADDFDNENIPF